MIKRIFICLLLCFVFIFMVSTLAIGKGNFLRDNRIDRYKPDSVDMDLDNKSGNRYKINVYISEKGKTENMDLENYVAGVVSGEMPVEFNIEALKAQAVAARTFAVDHMESLGGKKYKGAHGADVIDTVQCQVYMEKEDRLKKWPSKSGEEYWDKINKAVKETAGQVLTYEDKIVTEPYYFAVSSGETEDAKEVLNEDEPYLKSVSSPGDKNSTKYKSTVKMSYIEFINAINKSFPNSKVNLINVRSSIQILAKNKTGSIKTLKVGNVTMTGAKFRSILGLNSTNFTIKNNITSIEFNCIGYGHGLGMSQWGAKAMADGGANYIEILKHYYTGVEIKSIQNVVKKHSGCFLYIEENLI